MSDSILHLTKCINCGATLLNDRCDYCNTDYEFTFNFAERNSHSNDPRIAGYYKILDVAFNSRDFAESYNYANKILELDPDNRDIWGIKIYSALNVCSAAQFEAGAWQTALTQLINTNSEYAYKILDLIFNYTVNEMIYNSKANLFLMLNVTYSCLDRGIRDREKKAKILYQAIENRNLTFINQFQNKPTILYNIRIKYFSPEDNQKAAKVDKLGLIVGIISIPFCFVGVLGFFGLYFNLRTLKRIKSSESLNSSQEKKLATFGLGFSAFGAFLSILFLSSVFFGEPVDDKVNIEFVELSKFEDSDRKNTDPNICVYEIRIPAGEDSSKLVEAIKEKIGMDATNSISYYYYESMSAPEISRNDDWDTAFEKCDESSPVAITDVDGHANKFYRIADENGVLGDREEIEK